MHALYGLIGYPLGHSFSPAYFTEKFRKENIDASYQLFPMQDLQAFPALRPQHPALRGLNVTLPHKTAIMPLLDALSPAASAIGAVNCIAFKEGRSTGHNTDAAGFRDSLLPLLQPRHRQALVLGNGGAAKAVCYVLRSLGIAYRQVARTDISGLLTYKTLTPDLIRACPLLINTTPVGMSPHEENELPLPYEAIDERHLLYDLIYTPAETRFLTAGKQRGATVKNGLEMLHLQAEAAWQIWQQ